MEGYILNLHKTVRTLWKVLFAIHFCVRLSRGGPVHDDVFQYLQRRVSRQGMLYCPSEAPGLQYNAGAYVCNLA